MTGPREHARARWRWALGLAACLGFALLLPLAHVGLERSFPQGGAAAFQDTALYQAALLRSGEFRAILTGLWRQAGAEPNGWFALPLLPGLLQFGSSRPVYVATIAVCMVLPFALAAGALATRLAGRGEAARWIGAAAALAVPAVWVPTLQGYGDMGATALLTGALWLCCADRPRWRGAAIAGMLLGLAVLVRSSFLLAALALLLALCAEALRGPAEMRGRRLLLAALTGATALATVAALGFPLLRRLFAGELYLPFGGGNPLGAIGGYVAIYGLLPLLLAGWGLAWLRGRGSGGRIVLYFGAAIAFSLLMAAERPTARAAAPLTPVMVVGLAMLPWAVAERLAPVWHGRAMAALALLAVVNAWTSLAAVGWAPATTAGLLAQRHAPEWRPDHGEVRRLLAYLRQIAGSGERIHVIGASAVVSGDLLWHGDRAGQAHLALRRAGTFWKNPGLDIPQWYRPHDDSAPYPLAPLMQADLVVLADPLQQDDPWSQKTVAAAHAIFAEGWAFSRDFERLPERFALAGDVVVTLYRRLRPTTIETAVATLDALRGRFGRPPGQGDWLNLGRDMAWLTPGGGIEWQGAAIMMARAEPMAGAVVVAGELQVCVPGITVEAALVDAGGQRLGLASHRVSGLDGAFRLPLSADRPGYLVLRISADRARRLPRPCWLSFR